MPHSTFCSVRKNLVTPFVIGVGIFILFVLPTHARADIADTAVFYDSLDNLASINANGGSVSGNLGFSWGPNHNAANFDGTSYITYTNPVFNAESGSISLWVKAKSGVTGGRG